MATDAVLKPTRIRPPNALERTIVGVADSRGISIGRTADKSQVKALIERLHPVTTSKGLIRIGGEEDGGYLVPDDFEGIVACFSPGVDVVASFEGALVARGIPCYLADASVTGPPITDPLIHFDKKFLGVVNDEVTTTLDSWVKRYAPPTGDLLLQMDIEGGEWPVLLNVSDEVLRRFRIIVLEVHWIERLIDKVGFSIIYATLDRLLRVFHVVHNHPNNVKPPLKTRDFVIPGLLEITLLRQDRAAPTGYATSFPHALDRKNIPAKPDVVLPDDWFRRKG
ncbi:MAG: FkbM family methyltransferase [Capsulimonadaceae bacterium]